MHKHYFAILAVIIFPAVTFSQKNKVVDSTIYYQKQITKAYKQAMDSLEKTPLFVNYVQYKQRYNSYNAQTFFINALHTNYNTFNNSIAQSGFNKMNPMSYGFGFGYSGKYKHIISDFALSMLFPNNSKKGDETISSGLFNILFDIGYDVLQSNRISIYPYAGLSARFATLNYINKGTINPQYSNITDILVESENINSASFRLGYQAGVGVDVAVSQNKANSKSFILFVKAGVNQPFAKDKFKIQSTTYNPEINKGDWMLSIGVKFANRKPEFQ